MPNSLEDLSAKVCLTVSGCLISQGKVLLIKHKKFKSWLCPGGHIDFDQHELPHQAAEREFFEETGVRVKAFSPNLIEAQGESQYLPNPVTSNLHWACKDNYLIRTEGAQPTESSRAWDRGCEQHLNLVYLVRPIEKEMTLSKNSDETDDIAWFELAKLDESEIYGNVKQEIKRCQKLCQN